MGEPSRAFARAATLAGQFLLIAAAVGLIGWVLWQIKLAVLPVFVAALLCTALAPLVVWLEDRGWPTLGATWAVFGSFVLVLVGMALLIVPPTANELGNLGDSVRVGVEEVEDWLIDGPLGLDREQVEEFTSNPVDKAAGFLEEADISVTTGAMVVGEVLAGALLSLVLAFLLLKDGRRLQRWTLRHLPDDRHEPIRAGARRAFEALGGFLRGAAILGTVEGITIGVSVWAVGGSLAIPVALLTFVAAFFPIVGAVVAGAVATLVVLATAGVTEALIVLAIVIVVQQLDGDLLAPFIYGRSVQLHPAVILVALTAGGTVGGIVGAFLAVPLAAMGSAVASEVWDRRGDRWLHGSHEPRPRGGPETDPPAGSAPMEPNPSPS